MKKVFTLFTQPSKADSVRVCAILKAVPELFILCSLVFRSKKLMINILQRMALVNPNLVQTIEPAEETKTDLWVVSSPVVESPEMAGLQEAIREIEGQIGAVALDFSSAWTVSQLEDELLALEFQPLLLRVADVPVELTPFQDGVEPAGDQPKWIVKTNGDEGQYYWVTKSQIAEAFGLEEE